MMADVMVGPSAKLAHLRGTPPFSALEDDELAAVAFLADEVAAPTGYVLVYEGDWGDEVFVLAEGHAAVVVDGARLDTLGPGAMVGDVAPLQPPAPGATVVASSPVRFFVFDREGFSSLVDDHPSLWDGMGNVATGLTTARGPTVEARLPRRLPEHA